MGETWTPLGLCDRSNVCVLEPGHDGECQDYWTAACKGDDCGD
jgi:hypothetical protein